MDTINASPNTSTSRSEQPSMTAGVWLKPGATFTMPSTLTIRRTRSILAAGKQVLPDIEADAARVRERVALRGRRLHDARPVLPGLCFSDLHLRNFLLKSKLDQH